MKQKGIKFLRKYRYALFACIFAAVFAVNLWLIFLVFHNKIYWSLPEQIKAPKQLLNTAEIAFHERFGAPSLRMKVADSVVLQYRDNECVMSIFLNSADAKKKNIKKSRYVLFTRRDDLSESRNCLNNFTLSQKK